MSDSKIPIEALEGLMRKVFVERSIPPDLFWDAALKADLYVPLSQRSEQEEDKSIQLGVDSKGQNILWVFTSPNVLHEYTERYFTCYGLVGQEMFKKIKDIPHPVILIGPEGITLSLDAKLIQSLADGKVPVLKEKDAEPLTQTLRLKVTRAAEEELKPLEDRFVPLFQALTEVLAASFIKVEDENSGARLLLGLRLETNNRDSLKRIATEVAKAAEGVLDQGKTMDITLIDGSLKDAFEKWGKTFYKK